MKKAEQYLEFPSFSRDELIGQLVDQGITEPNDARFGCGGSLLRL